MKHNKRVLSAVLALVMTLTLLGPMASAAGTAVYNGTNYSTDYTTWRQGDPAWGNTPLGDVHTFGGSGCLISSIAVLMCHSGAYDPASLNPGVLRDWLDSKGCISHSADRWQDALLSFGLITPTISPRFYFVNQEFFATTTPMEDVCLRIGELMASGYHVVARVKNSGHFVAVANTIGTSDARIYDSGAVSKQLLSEYNGTIGGLIYFKANLAGKDTILPNHAIPSAPVLSGMASAYGTGDSIPVTWSSVSLATHYNLYVEQKQADGTWLADYRYHFYVQSPFSLAPLPAGTYRLKAQSTNANANPWTFANSEWHEFKVQAGQLTVWYDANGGTCATPSKLVRPWTAYELPTPTKNGAAFLGWYDGTGKLVNSSTYISTNNGHTLTAKWDNGKVGFSKTNSYSNNFWDVKKTAWYYDSVAQCYAYGLMNGVDAWSFQPDSQITAAQAVTLAARMHKLYTTGTSTFPVTSPWHKAYSDYCVSKGILSSSAVPENMDCTMTRQEFAAILANALPSSGLPAVNNVPNGSIPDVYRSDAAIYRLYRAGIFAGIDAQGTFRPNNPITRAEVATVLVRMADPNVRVLFSIG